MHIDDLLRLAMERKASDLHLKVGNYPHLRVDGELVPLTDQPRISAEDMLNMAFSMMSNRQKQKFKESAELDMAYGVAGLGRFRVNVFQQRGNVGLVLVTGVTGSGKSTTLAAMLDRINSTRPEHIITIEDPIEFLHRDKKGFVNQREVEVDTPSFASALRASLRQDPDVILVGEMRDLETISTALHAAETGHLVFSTLHTLDAVETINRIIAVFPPPEQKQVRMQLMVSTASSVCNVENTRCPVSAACSAVEIVSRSRMSPTRITSGSWRKLARSADANAGVSTSTSRWLTKPFLSRCRNSIGSSIVMMCSGRLELIRSSMAASVVDLPEPVTPVTSTMPRASSQMCSMTLGRYSSSRARILVGITRRTSPTLPRCWNTFTRKRPRPATP